MAALLAADAAFHLRGLRRADLRGNDRDTTSSRRKAGNALRDRALCAPRGGWNEQGFGFYGVMGPDEFHMMVDNDFLYELHGQKALMYAATCWKSCLRTRTMR